MYLVILRIIVTISNNTKMNAWSACAMFLLIIQLYEVLQYYCNIIEHTVRSIQGRSICLTIAAWCKLPACQQVECIFQIKPVNQAEANAYLKTLSVIDCFFTRLKNI